MTDQLLIAFGALGLILLGMEWMSSGLKASSGPKFLQALETWTTTPIRSVLFGTTATVAVQSSSAITVATIGFVNAGVLSLRKAAFVVYGSNVGTSLTGWFIALVGVQFKIDAFALPLIGLGAVAKLFGSKSAIKGAGDAAIGFGALFLGLSFLKSSFDASGFSLDIPFLSESGLTGLLLAVLIGTLLTALMQASVAVIALVLTAVSTSTMDIHVAAAFVIGANLGTTSTALMSTLAATANAKRLAWLHVIFNLLTALVAVLLMTPILELIHLLEVKLAIESSPAISLAIFHSLFNIMGVLLMWPMTDRLVAWLSNRFKGKAVALKYVDTSSLLLPDTAVKAIGNELLDQLMKLGHVAAQSDSSATSLDKIMDSIRSKQKRIAEYLDKLSETPLTKTQARALTVLAKSHLRLDTVIQLISKLNNSLAPFNGNFAEERTLWQSLVTTDYDSTNFKRGYRAYLKSIDKQKQAIYNASLSHKLTHEKATELVLSIHEVKRMNIQLIKASSALRKLLADYEMTDS
ncbi:Na/Pi cotransporter family protein [Pseudoalteromonas xiamenensis]|uniref:Na/Pi cotransporter family protein n=1 Tax=Pseudoalteromonas xiamenensis TaxID=882626 RepID=A0A975HL15_9GAMM|nr:Na/Pi symporter [Pseudoalteromonas xiamenensis]QTH71487.1 Na/Pi cotransporter family protein [Pseudoalteromonas xiamenensis]